MLNANTAKGRMKHFFSESRKHDRLDLRILSYNPESKKKHWGQDELGGEKKEFRALFQSVDITNLIFILNVYIDKYLSYN